MLFRKKALRINTYLGYGTKTLFRASGRALEDEKLKLRTNQNLFNTLKNIYKQLESDEIRKAPIKICINDQLTFKTITDQEGYYHYTNELPNISSYTDKQGWLSYFVSYENQSTKIEISTNNIFKSQMLIPSSQAEYGIISDIDDTILHTGVASLLKWRVITNTIFKNFDKRIPTQGIVNYYKKLQLGNNNNPCNPFFYVSNSPWNLYDYLTAFLTKNNFPKGPILLRDFRTPFDKTPKPVRPHKESEIINLLNIYPHLKFILIGDSGEKDADIYCNIANTYPNRILAIYLRNVNHKRKEMRIKKIIDSNTVTPILLFNTIDEAITHAKYLNYIA